MRISTNLMFQRGLDSLQRSESALYKVQQQLTRQTKILSPSDDPIANSQVMNLNNALAQNEQFMRNSTSLEANLRQPIGQHTGHAAATAAAAKMLYLGADSDRYLCVAGTLSLCSAL